MTDRAGGLQRLLDEAEIRRVIYARARASDRRDTELALSCYHDGATEDHEGFRGLATDYVKQSQIARPDVVPVMYHFIGNMHIQFTDDGAIVETYCVAMGQINGERVGDALVASRYIDWFTNRDGRWAIQARTMVIDHSRWEESGVRYADVLQVDAAAINFGRPDRTDPSYTVAQSLGVGW